ncbi:hypothetical protein [Rufibacter sp. XAAS-G3-1]|uniref:hypothetical protein n=1 Tax=Rufibacter sp. XAAS-G3-1 TaxID=2729134 RepID=UPI0015E69019|nr:hypothetical protein [Rufibacter sp. XAAS-G3-1]
MDTALFKKSLGEVFWLSAIAFFPLILTILLQAIKLNDVVAAIQIVNPGEFLAFCLSFLAPSIFFLKKTHGKSYSLPFLDFFFFSTIFMYIAALLITYIIKNNVDPEITNNINSKIYYLIGSAIFLLITIGFRVYSVYHTSKSSDFIKNKKDEEIDFNKTFKDSIHGS